MEDIKAESKSLKLIIKMICEYISGQKQFFNKSTKKLIIIKAHNILKHMEGLKIYDI